MKRAPTWVDRSVVEAMHDAQVAEHGGFYGVRDEGLLESALARPRDRFNYDQSADLCAIAAAYGFGLAKNHAFVDGNKRVALVTMGVFLVLNHLMIKADEPEIVTVMLGVAGSSISEDELAAWLRAHTKRL
ncbi:MAG TPA: type II toxin-antitoxin system death-on-curing family toxin [Gemmatimonadaceae bacterium]|nr:type II toxin-antitoxin system death-on-curing family toxin [Gemmatimonadaceae bacterium]